MAADRPDPMQSTSGNTNASTPSTSGAIAREHRLLFRGKSRRRERDDSRSNDNGMPRQKRRIWTHMFCALAGMHCPIVPSQPELIALQQCGLGLRDITFDFDGDAVNVQTTICSAFPRLENAGGFELLVLKSGSRKILISTFVGPVPVSRLKHITSGRIYIRPLQKNLDVTPIKASALELQQECLTCHEVMPVTQIPKHYRVYHKFVN